MSAKQFSVFISIAVLLFYVNSTAFSSAKNMPIGNIGQGYIKYSPTDGLTEFKLPNKQPVSYDITKHILFAFRCKGGARDWRASLRSKEPFSIPHSRIVDSTTIYPILEADYRVDDCPVTINMKVFSPFIVTGQSSTL